ncbi:MAG: sugar-binding transcriptional regulator [Tissierellia bacterium]|nr:sugar-binding transcriptional regulator [Tissierellia bacterium]
MVEVLKVFEFIPEAKDLFIKRYRVLEGVKNSGGIGRRLLSIKLELTERVIRDEVEKLKKLGFINVTNLGMNITDKGELFLEDMNDIYSELIILPKSEIQLGKLLNLDKVIVIKGNTTSNEDALKDLGAIASKYFVSTLRDDMVISVTGGSTILAMANSTKTDKSFSNIMVVPARGGIGNFVEEQSNSIASKFAEALGGEFKPLYLPDDLDSKMIDVMMHNQNIREFYELLGSIDILVFGIGRADIMARKRELDAETTNMILENGAVAESFGHYFDIDGEEVYHHSTIGISMDCVKSIPKLIAVAGSSIKAEAIIAVSKIRSDMTLIIDENAAMKIIELYNENGGV